METISVISLEEFENKFKFDKSKVLNIGLEREAFILKDNLIVPKSPDIISVIEKLNLKWQSVGYELSACQLELRYGPSEVGGIKNILRESEKEMAKIKSDNNFDLLFADVAPEEISLDVYPDPTGRYQNLSQTLPHEILRAACMVAGTHVHVGMPDLETAIRIYDCLIPHTKELLMSGDGSNGERIGLYQQMAPKCQPVFLKDEKEWYDRAVENGYVEDPRKCWTWIRISIHGTIEFRVFGSTPDLNKIEEWIYACHALCKKYL